MVVIIKSIRRPVNLMNVELTKIFLLQHGWLPKWPPTTRKKKGSEQK